MEAEIWVEKYRPKTLDEVVGQDEVVRRLKSYVEQKNIPHLLFAGPPGTGKTATAIALTRDLFGENWRDNFIEMNASVTADTPILIRINGVVKRTTFKEIDLMFFKDEETHVVPLGLEVLSFYNNIGFYPVSFISRHEADRILRIKYEGGEVKTTHDHSVIVLNDEGRLVSKRADKIKKGDFLLSFKKNTEFPSISEFVREKYPYFTSVKDFDRCSWLNWTCHVDNSFRSELQNPFYSELKLIGCISGISTLNNGFKRNELIDIAWLGRILGFDTSITGDGLRIFWRSHEEYKTNCLPADPFKRFFKLLDDRICIDWKDLLNGRRRVEKSILLKVLNAVRIHELEHFELRAYMRFRTLAESDLYAVEVKDVERINDQNCWVYDFSVPVSESFFGGTTPVLLHNSDERGIDVVRHKIKEFARTAPIGGAPFKIIFLDEADALTPDAQAALRRTMEMYSKTCRFILSCNYISRIIEPIQSRCAVFKFKPVPADAMKRRLMEIAKNEGIEITEDGLDALIYIANGDFRKAINALQGASAFREVIDADAIYQITATARPEEIKRLVSIALDGRFMEARELLDKLMVEYGMSGEDIVSQLFREITASDIDEKLKVLLIDKLGEIDFRLTEGAHDRIQLDAYLAYLATLKKR